VTGRRAREGVRRSPPDRAVGREARAPRGRGPPLVPDLGAWRSPTFGILLPRPPRHPDAPYVRFTSASLRILGPYGRYSNNKAPRSANRAGVSLAKCAN